MGRNETKQNGEIQWKTINRYLIFRQSKTTTTMTWFESIWKKKILEANKQTNIDKKQIRFTIIMIPGLYVCLISVLVNPLMMMMMVNTNNSPSQWTYVDGDDDGYWPHLNHSHGQKLYFSFLLLFCRWLHPASQRSNQHHYH